MAASWNYFNLPEDDKRRWMPPSPYVFRGYFPIQSSALAGSLDVETPPDLCEVFAVNRFDDPADATAASLREGREGFFAPNIWPDVEGFREAWTDYYRAMESLANELMALMALALGLEEDWFDIPTCTTADDPPHYEPVTSGQWVLDKLSKSVY